MPSCEKCWADAGWPAYSGEGDQVEIYRQLVSKRSCTPEEQAGPDAGYCQRCKRSTVHQHIRMCMVCEVEPSTVQGARSPESKP